MIPELENKFLNLIQEQTNHKEEYSMRQLNMTVEDFSTETEKYFNNRYSTVCTSFGRVDSKQLTSYLQDGYLYKYKLKEYDGKELKLLALGSWFLDNHFGGILREDIRQKVENGSLDTNMRIEIFPYLENKQHALHFLALVDERFSASDWYGNLLTRLDTLLFNVKLLLFKPTKRNIKRYTGYCRGYKSSKPGKTIEKQVIENNNFLLRWENLKSSDTVVTLLHNQAMQFYLERDFENYKIILETLKKFSEERRILLNFFGMSGTEALERMKNFEKRSKEIRAGKFLK